MMRRIFWPKPESEQADWLIKEGKEKRMIRQKTTILYENTVQGIFVRRINRFTADVLIDGQPEFKEALVSAAKAGVQIVCYGCSVEADSIKITSGTENTVMFAG